jgi:hypothetical protein
VLLILFLGLCFTLAFTALLSPWAFFLGGSFHPLPWWRGWGRMHSPAGDYVLFAQIVPRPGGRRVSHLRGTAFLCTPRGEIYNLQITGDFDKQPLFTSNVDGLHLYLAIQQKLNFLATNRGTRLRFQIDGAWEGPELVTTDKGSLARAFNPDATLYTADPNKRPPAGQPLSLTLKEGSRADFDSACAAIKPH